VYHPSSPRPYPGGQNLLQRIDANDIYANHRKESTVHYPFASRAEWQLANWLAGASLSQAEINSFLKLDYVSYLPRCIRETRLTLYQVSQNPPTITSAQDLRNRVEELPHVPRWQHQDIKIDNFRTKEPITLYWRDGLEVVQHLFANPVFANCMETNPYKLLEVDTGLQVYGEFMSAEYAWNYQVRSFLILLLRLSCYAQSTIPPGHTMIGVIGASDKTPLTIGSGNKEMHPLLLSIANIDAGVRMKATSHAFALAAYLPIPKFLDVSPPVQACLAARVFHICLSIVTSNLRVAEKNGVVMSDPAGLQHVCHTPLASWIADLPEQRMLACVLGNQSPFSTATHDEFGDDYEHPRRTRDHTLQRIRHACLQTIPTFIPAFLKTCQPLGLNGVHQPFWRDWGDADPSRFLTPDALHAWHKFVFDHALKWVINIMGGNELDRRMSAIQPRVGVRHWRNGISKLKQITGREHRDLQKVLVVVAAGAVPASVLRAIRALIEFVFQAQSLLLYDEHLHALGEALREFHTFKNAIVNAGGRLGKNGPIAHFKIPKLEGLWRVAWNARMMGAPYQWTSDITERCHITHVKTPYRRSNRRNFHEQCVRYMDRIEKMRLFGLYTSLKSNRASLLNEMVDEALDVANHYPEATWLSHILPPNEIMFAGQVSKPTLFTKGRSHLSDDNHSAFLVNKMAHLRSVTVDEAAQLFNLSDFHAALGDYFCLKLTHAQRRGQRRSRLDCALPFSHVAVWYSFRMQQHSVQDSRIVLPSRTIQALPPSNTMPYGRCNTVLLNDVDGSGDRTSSSGEDRKYFALCSWRLTIYLFT